MRSWLHWLHVFAYVVLLVSAADLLAKWMDHHHMHTMGYSLLLVVDIVLIYQGESASEPYRPKGPDSSERQSDDHAPPVSGPCEDEADASVEDQQGNESRDGEADEGPPRSQ